MLFFLATSLNILHSVSISRRCLDALHLTTIYIRPQSAQITFDPANVALSGGTTSASENRRKSQRREGNQRRREVLPLLRLGEIRDENQNGLSDERLKGSDDATTRIDTRTSGFSRFASGVSGVGLCPTHLVAAQGAHLLLPEVGYHPPTTDPSTHVTHSATPLLDSLTARELEALSDCRYIRYTCTCICARPDVYIGYNYMPDIRPAGC